MAVDRKVVKVVDVVRQGTKLILPEDVKYTYDDAIEECQRRKADDEKAINVIEEFDCFVWDGALATTKAITEMFGSAAMVDIPGFWGDTPPTFLKVTVSPTETVEVFWGRLKLPGVVGEITTGYKFTNDGIITYQISGAIKKKSMGILKTLFARIREIVRAESIYKGKAFEIKFLDSDGEAIPMPEPKFLTLPESRAIFTRQLEEEIQDNILTPIRQREFVRATGGTLKKGILLAGRYGTGKTLVAGVIAKEGVKHGWTFIYGNIDEFPRLIAFAQKMQPAIVFVEDGDRGAGSERTDEVNDILNSLDGIGNKDAEIITIMTSNHPENINEAMRRPGRIDLTLHITPPDNEAAERIVRHYGGSLVKAEENLTEVGKVLSGEIAAAIREVVERSKLSAIRRIVGDTDVVVSDTAGKSVFPEIFLTSEDLLRAARTYKTEKNLFSPKKPVPAAEVVATAIGRGFAGPVREVIRDIARGGANVETDTVQEFIDLSGKDSKITT